MPAAGAVARHAVTRGSSVAVRAAAGARTYAALHDRTDRVASGLHRLGLRPGDRVALSLPDPLELLVGLLACDRIGATSVVLDPAWPTTLRSAAIEEAEASVLLDDELPSSSAPVDLDLTDGRERFLAVFTSGSTGRPRAVLRSRGSWRRSFAPFTRLTGIGTGSTVLLPGPLTSTLFLFAAVHALDCGATVLLDRPDTPLPWTAGHFVPTMLADLAAAPYDVTGRTAIAAGAALPATLAETLGRRGLDIVSYYGAAELSLVAAGRGRLDPFPGVEVRLGGGPTGEIWVRSGYLAAGYLGEVDGPLRRDARGFATVGDLGRRSPDGGLDVLGRADGVVLTGGATVLPAEVEAVLRELPGVREVTVVGSPHPRLGRVVTAVLEDAGGLPSLSSLRAVAAERLTPGQRPRLWYALPRLPRTSAGKVARSVIESGLADGSLAAVRLR